MINPYPSEPYQSAWRHGFDFGRQYPTYPNPTPPDFSSWGYNQSITGYCSRVWQEGAVGGQQSMAPPPPPPPPQPQYQPQYQPPPQPQPLYQPQPQYQPPPQPQFQPAPQPQPQPPPQPAPQPQPVAALGPQPARPSPAPDSASKGS